jgi:hypothetical protein
MKTLIAFVLSSAAAFTFCASSAEKVDTPPNAATEKDAQLAAEAERLFPLSQKTAGKEAANFLFGTNWMHEQLLCLKGERKGNLKSARVDVGRFVDEMQKGQDWPSPEPIQIPKAKGALKIDGDINADEWKDALVLEKAYEVDTKTAGGQRTVWRLLWDNDFLYISCECADSDIQAPRLEHDGALYNYDCVEVFILPDMKTLKFCELIVSPSGPTFDALHTKYADAWGEGPGGPNWTMKGLKTASMFQKEDGKPVGFTIEIAIPLKELPGFEELASPANRSVSLMLVRADKNGTGTEAPKYYSYTPLLRWAHNIWNYGKATFVEK